MGEKNVLLSVQVTYNTKTTDLRKIKKAISEAVDRIATCIMVETEDQW